ncbi:MAG: hypothetical protein KJZ54_04470 [Phycisphaerales bacterium]|nr:hypothetical protein [Phycisphaerales bacterium]
MTLRLGDLLVTRGLLSPEQRDLVLEAQRTRGRPFGALAEDMFGLDPALVEAAWAEQYAAVAPRIDPLAEAIDLEALSLVERRQAWQFSVLPLRFEAGELMVCTTREALPRALKFVGWRLAQAVYLVTAEREAFVAALKRHYPAEGMAGLVREGRPGAPMIS